MKIKNKIKISTLTLLISSLIPSFLSVSCSSNNVASEDSLNNYIPNDYIKWDVDYHNEFYDSNGLYYSIENTKYDDNYHIVSKFLFTDKIAFKTIDENLNNGVLDLRKITRSNIKVQKETETIKTLKDYNSLSSYKISNMEYPFYEVTEKLFRKDRDRFNKLGKVKQIITNDDMFLFYSDINFYSGFYDSNFLFSKNSTQEISNYNYFSTHWQDFQLLNQIEDYGNPKKIVISHSDRFYYSYKVPEIIFFNNNTGWYRFIKLDSTNDIKNIRTELIGNYYWPYHNPFLIWLASIDKLYSPIGLNGVSGKRIYINKEMQNFPGNWNFLQNKNFYINIKSRDKDYLKGWVSQEPKYDKIYRGDYIKIMKNEFKKFNTYYENDKTNSDGIKYNDLYTIKIFLSQPMHLYNDLIKKSFKSMEEMITQFNWDGNSVNNENTWPLNKQLPPNTRRIFKFIEPGKGDLNDPYESQWNDESYRDNKLTYKGNINEL